MAKQANRKMIGGFVVIAVAVFAADKNSNQPEVSEATASTTKTIEADTLQAIAIYPEYKAPATVVTLNDSEISSEIACKVSLVGVVGRGDTRLVARTGMRKTI